MSDERKLETELDWWNIEVKIFFSWKRSLLTSSSSLLQEYISCYKEAVKHKTKLPQAKDLLTLLFFFVFPPPQYRLQYIVKEGSCLWTQKVWAIAYWLQWVWYRAASRKCVALCWRQEQSSGRLLVGFVHDEKGVEAGKLWHRAEEV